MNLVTVLGTGGTQSLLSIVVVYAVVIGVFWFFAIRPQKKQQKECNGWGTRTRAVKRCLLDMTRPLHS